MTSVREALRLPSLDVKGSIFKYWVCTDYGWCSGEGGRWTKQGNTFDHKEIKEQDFIETFATTDFDRHVPNDTSPKFNADHSQDQKDTARYNVKFITITSSHFKF